MVAGPGGVGTRTARVLTRCARAAFAEAPLDMDCFNGVMASFVPYYISAKEASRFELDNHGMRRKTAAETEALEQEAGGRFRKLEALKKEDTLAEVMTEPNEPTDETTPGTLRTSFSSRDVTDPVVPSAVMKPFVISQDSTELLKLVLDKLMHKKRAPRPPPCRHTSPTRRHRAHLPAPPGTSRGSRGTVRRCLGGMVPAPPTEESSDEERREYDAFVTAYVNNLAAVTERPRLLALDDSASVLYQDDLAVSLAEHDMNGIRHKYHTLPFPLPAVSDTPQGRMPRARPPPPPPHQTTPREPLLAYDTRLLAGLHSHLVGRPAGDGRLVHHVAMMLAVGMSAMLGTAMLEGGMNVEDSERQSQARARHPPAATASLRDPRRLARPPLHAAASPPSAARRPAARQGAHAHGRRAAARAVGPHAARPAAGAHAPPPPPAPAPSTPPRLSSRPPLASPHPRPPALQRAVLGYDDAAETPLNKVQPPPPLPQPSRPATRDPPPLRSRAPRRTSPHPPPPPPTVALRRCAPLRRAPVARPARRPSRSRR